MMTTPGYHVVARVQNTNRPQSNILCRIKHLLVFTRECIEVGNRSSYFRDWENRYSFAVYFEGSHIGSSTFDCSNCLYCNFDSFPHRPGTDLQTQQMQKMQKPTCISAAKRLKIVRTYDPCESLLNMLSLYTTLSGVGISLGGTNV